MPDPLSRPADALPRRVDIHMPPQPDPVAALTSQAACRRGGANFRAQDLVLEQGRITTRPTVGMPAFLAGFTAVTAIVVAAVGPSLFSPGLGQGLFWGAWGLLMAGGVVVARSQARRVDIDLEAGRYRVADGASDQRPGPLEGPLSEVHALQLLAKRIEGSPSFVSHELNLVLRSGERLNLLDHGDRRAIEAAARALSTRLGLPVWAVQNVWRV